MQNKKITYKDISGLLSINDRPDFDCEFEKIATLEDADNDSLTFFINDKYIEQLKNTKAKACILAKQYSDMLPSSCIPIIVDNPHMAYAKVTYLFYPPDLVNLTYTKNLNNQIAATAKIGKNVQLGKNIVIGENTVIGDDVQIGDNSIIDANIVLGNDVIIGNNCRLYPNVVITHTKIADNVVINAGSVIGKEGFGFAIDQQQNNNLTIPHLGKVLIADNVVIGSNCNIDRGSITNTQIGSNSRMDNLVQIAHNVKIGNNVIIVAQTGIAGSSVIGNNVVLGGQVGVSGHVKIADNVIIAAKSGVTKSISQAGTYGGFPAKPINEWHKETAKLRLLLRKKS